MIDHFFARFMRTEAGKSLLSDIPQERKKLVQSKMQVAFFAGVEISPIVHVMDQIYHLNSDEKKMVLEFLKDDLNLTRGKCDGDVTHAGR